MYKCCNCSNVFEEPIKRFSKETGNYFSCPDCGMPDDFIELKPCEICGELYDEDVLHDGMCIQCIEDNTSFETIVDILKDDEKEPAYLNPFFTQVFTDSEIAEIITEYINSLSDKERKELCNKFIRENIQWFPEALKEVYK